MSGKKGKKLTPELSAATTFSSSSDSPSGHYVPTPHTCPCACAAEVHSIKKFLFAVVQPLVKQMETIADTHGSVTKHIETLAETISQHSSTVAAIQKQVTELTAKSQVRYSVIEARIAELRTEISQKLQATSVSSPSSPSLVNDSPNSINSCDKTISSIQAGLRNLNKRIRKNNIVIHGLDNSKENCITQANTFFQTYLKIQLPIQQAYRLGSSTSDRIAPLLVGFPSLHTKLEIFKRCKMLSGTKFSIQDDLSPEEREERSRNLAVFKKYRSEKKKVTFRGGDLYVEGRKVMVK